MIHLVGEHMLFEILGRIEHGTGFEQGDVDAEIGQDLDGGAAAGAGADHDHVEHLGTTLDLEHVGSLSISHSGDWRAHGGQQWD